MMTTDRINAQLGSTVDPTEILNILKAAGGEIADDLSLAMSAIPLQLFWTKELPLTEEPPEITRLWTPLGKSMSEVADLEQRLDQLIDEMHNSLVLARLADILWWGLPSERRDFHRHARRGLEAHRAAVESSGEPVRWARRCRRCD